MAVDGSRPRLVQTFLDLPNFSDVLDFLAAPALLRSARVAPGWNSAVQAILTRRHCSRPLFTSGGLFEEKADEGFGDLFSSAIQQLSWVPEVCVIFTTSDTELSRAMETVGPGPDPWPELLVDRLPPRCVIVCSQCEGVIGPDLLSPDGVDATELFSKDLNGDLLKQDGTSFMFMRAWSVGEPLRIITGGVPGEVIPNCGDACGYPSSPKDWDRCPDNKTLVDLWLQNASSTVGTMQLVLFSDDGTDAWHQEWINSMNGNGRGKYAPVGGIVIKMFASRFDGWETPSAPPGVRRSSRRRQGAGTVRSPMREVHMAALTVPATLPSASHGGTASRAVVLGMDSPCGDAYCGAARAAFDASGLTELKFSPQAGFVSTCVERGPVFHNSNVNIEAAAHGDILGRHVPLVGFFAYGELGPESSGNGGAAAHGYSTVVGVFGALG